MSTCNQSSSNPPSRIIWNSYKKRLSLFMPETVSSLLLSHHLPTTLLVVKRYITTELWVFRWSRLLPLQIYPAIFWSATTWTLLLCAASLCFKQLPDPSVPSYANHGYCWGLQITICCFSIVITQSLSLGSLQSLWCCSSFEHHNP